MKKRSCKIVLKIKPPRDQPILSFFSFWIKITKISSLPFSNSVLSSRGVMMFSSISAATRR